MHPFLRFSVLVCVVTIILSIPSCLVSFLYSRDKVSVEAGGPLPPGVLAYFLDGILPLFRVGADSDLEPKEFQHLQDVIQYK